MSVVAPPALANEDELKRLRTLYQLLSSLSRATSLQDVYDAAISGLMTATGADRAAILMFDDDGVMIHAMHKAAAARITLRSVEELEKLAKKIVPMSYDIRDYAKLGLLYKLLHVEDPEKPSAEDIRNVQNELVGAIADARSGPVDLRNRLESKGARETRKASLLVRSKLEAQWLEN